MKHIKITICILIAIISFNACNDDFLIVDSANKLYIDDYYTTESRIFEALVAAYDPLRWTDYAWDQYTQIGLVSDIMADDVYVGGSDANDCIYLHRMADYSALPTSVVGDLWTVMYNGVSRSNNVLEHMDDVKNISDEKKALYIAEAKVLRSFYYNWLWKLWGNIPYYEENLVAPYTCPQSTANEVYNNIIASLESAIENGGLPMRASSGWEGRVTFAMAAMLYTEVVMYQKDETRYAKALGYLEEIINSNKYILATDFAGIWESSGEWCDESIFEINYFSTAATRGWSNPRGDGGSVYPKFIGISGLSGSTEYTAGWGFEPVRAEAYEMYDAADTRRDGGILNFAQYAAATGANYTPRYQDNGYFLRKYIAREGGNANQAADADMNFNNNYRVYRYSETLLYAAELLARGVSGSGSAQTYLDLVRNRAGLGSITPTVDNILTERRLEFVGEGKRYWDLIRTGKASTYLTPNAYRTKTWTESKKHLPIPQSEIDAAKGTLTQNNY